MPNVTHTVAPAKEEGYSSLVVVITGPAFLGHGNKIVSILPRRWFEEVELNKMSVWLCDTTLVTHTQTHTQTRTLLYHLPGVGLLWSGQTNESLAVSVCVDCVEVKRMGETAAVKGNRATHLNPLSPEF